MKKTVWIVFGIALVVVNLAAWLVEQATGLHLAMLLRLAMILGITMAASIFVGAYVLLSKFEEEQPLTGEGGGTLERGSGKEGRSVPGAGPNGQA